MSKLLKLFGDGQKFALTADEKDKAKEDYAEQYISTRQLLFLTINSSTGTAMQKLRKHISVHRPHWPV